MSRAKRATKRKDEDEHEGPGDAAGGAGDLGIKWTEVGMAEGVPLLLVADSAQDKGSAKVIGFDIDWTIIRTKSGKTFPTSAADWIFWNDVVPKKLKEKHDEGFRIVFFTNQGGIEKGKATVKEMETKFTNIVKAVGFPIPVLSSTGNSQYRKPSIDMWDYFEQNLNRGVKVDRKSMIFVGDAAGRPKNWKAGTSKDFSAGDRMFAANIGCEFQTPEEFFLGEKAHPVFDWDALNPKTFYETIKDKKLPELTTSKQEIVVLVGQPASGKSTLRKKVFEPKGYVGVNRDTLKTPEKCIKVAQAAVDEGKSVVVDNTNPSPDARAPYVAMAKKKGIPVRAIFIDISPELAAHLNYHRQNLTAGESRRVPGVAYATYRKNFKEPAASEGFASVTKLDFIPNFADDKEKERFLHWNCSD